VVEVEVEEAEAEEVEVEVEVDAMEVNDTIRVEKKGEVSK
jgi:hypothetical protein